MNNTSLQNNISTKTSTESWYSPLAEAFEKLDEEIKNKSFAQSVKEGALTQYYVGKGILRWGLNAIEAGNPAIWLARDLHHKRQDPVAFQKKCRARFEKITHTVKGLSMLGINLVRHPIKTREALAQHGFKELVRKFADFIALPQSKKFEAIGELIPDIALCFIGVGEAVSVAKASGATGLPLVARVAAEFAVKQVPKNAQEISGYVIPKFHEATHLEAEKSLADCVLSRFP